MAREDVWQQRTMTSQSGTQTCAALSNHGATLDLACSKLAILSDFCSVMPMSSRPLRRQFLRKASVSNVIFEPSSRVMDWLARSTSRRLPSSQSFMSASTSALGRMMGSIPFCMKGNGGRDGWLRKEKQGHDSDLAVKKT